MEINHNGRRNFIKNAAIAGTAMALVSKVGWGADKYAAGKRVGIIGLDTSHSVAFTKALNATVPDSKLNGYKVVAAYPYGSKTIASSTKRIPGFTTEVKKLGVTIVDSISELLRLVDVVLLETNDGRLHLEQALEVMKAGKRLFIDKPIAASLHDTKAIFEASKMYNVPLFSSSSLRYVENIADIVSGNLVGDVTGAETFSPALIEPTHPDLFWYGIHGVEMLYAILGPGCQQVRRVYHPDTDIVIGTWEDGRLGTFRGLRTGKHEFGGLVFGEKGHVAVSEYTGYLPLLYQIVKFFDTGIPPVAASETTEIIAFLEAADESKRQQGAAVDLKQFMGA